jgi:hypothetical protein
MLFELASTLATFMVGVLAFWLIDKLVVRPQPSRVLKILVILLCAAAILQLVGPRFA